MTKTAVAVIDAELCCAPLAQPDLSAEEVTRAATVFKALADPNRVRIVNLLATTDDPVCVCNLMEPLGLSQPTVSHHLKRLLDAGLLRREERGTWAYYSLRRDVLRGLASVFELDAPSV